MLSNVAEAANGVSGASSKGLKQVVHVVGGMNCFRQCMNSVSISFYIICSGLYHFFTTGTEF